MAEARRAPKSRAVVKIPPISGAGMANGWLERFIESRIEDVLNRVDIPSRSDIERLNRSVDLLTAKVEVLLSRKAASPARPRATPRRGN